MERVFGSLEERGFLGLVGLGSIFLYTTYFLALCLAFHDVARGGLALQGAMGEDFVRLGQSPAQASPSPDAETAEMSPAPEFTGLIRFPSESVELEDCEEQVLSRLRDRWSLPDVAAFEQTRDSFPANHKCRGIFQSVPPTVWTNFLQMKKAVETIERLSGRVYLFTRCAPFAVPGDSVGDASQHAARRMESLRGVLVANVHDRSRIQLLPQVKGAPGAPESGSVVFSVYSANSSKEPSGPTWGSGNKPLLDYLYFMIYTVTTTGYGDFRPATGYAKFLSSVGNLVEILFLVVAFNLFHTMRARRSTGEAEQGSATPPTSKAAASDQSYT